jgi:hypothetical protein
LNFAEKLWQVAGRALEIAMAVSRLEHINSDRKYWGSASARSMPQPGLQAGLAELEEHLRHLYPPTQV